MPLFKKSHKKGKDKQITIGAPSNFEKRSHVSADFEWVMEGTDPEKVFELAEIVGEGSFGVVYRATHIESGFPLAVKSLARQGSNSEWQEVKKEIEILKDCSHDAIVKYYGSLFHEDRFWILMDFCGAGSIYDLTQHRGRPLTEEEIGAVMVPVVEGLSYLHSRKIIHRDLKGGNILLTEDGLPKIADFGVSSVLSGTMAKAQTVIGTPLYMAPEVLNGTAYDKRADTWSLAITAIEFAEGGPPHMKEHFMRAMFIIANNEPPTLQEPEKWSSEFNDFLTTCLVKDPEDRPTVDALMNHPFLEKSRKQDNKAILVALAKEAKSVAEEDDDTKTDEVSGDQSATSTMEREEEEEDRELSEEEVVGSSNRLATEHLSPAKPGCSTFVDKSEERAEPNRLGTEKLVVSKIEGASKKVPKKKKVVKKGTKKDTISNLQIELAMQISRRKKAEDHIKALRNQLQNSSSSLDAEKQAKLQNLLSLLKDWKEQTELVERAVTQLLDEAPSSS